MLTKMNLHGKEITPSDEIKTTPSMAHYAGLFQIMTSEDTDGGYSRVLALGADMTNDKLSKMTLMFNLPSGMSKDQAYDDQSIDKVSPHWKVYNTNDISEGEHYFSVSVEKTNDEEFSQRFYVDGEQKVNAKLSAPLMKSAIASSSNFIHIGTFEKSYNGQQFKDKIKYMACMSNLTAKCIRIYNKGLTPEEVKENYQDTMFYHDEIMGKELK